MLHDRWGSLTGGIYSSGTEEEWAITEELYKDNKIRNVALFFKDVDLRQLSDPGKQLGAVLALEEQNEEDKRYLFKQYGVVDQFAETLEGHLARWLRDHVSATHNLSTTGLVTGGATTASLTDARALAVAPPVRFLDYRGYQIVGRWVFGLPWCNVLCIEGDRDDALRH